MTNDSGERDTAGRRFVVTEEIAEALTAMEPGAAVLRALQRFFACDADLLKLDANERTITHRFAMYLQDELPDWHVDCEYNRDGHDPKRVSLPTLHPRDDDSDATTVFPDVIVHHRGLEENYLVLEFKKIRNGLDGDVDRQKLRAYKKELHYSYALFVAIGVWRRCGELQIEWVG